MKELGSVKFGEVIIKIISNSEILTVAELHFPSGVSAEVHQHINEEVNYVVKGTFETIHKGETVLLKQGDVLQVNSNLKHNLKCTSTENGIIVTAWAPSRKDLIAMLDI